MEALILQEPDMPSTSVPCSGLRSFKTLENYISAHLLVRSYISISLLFLSSWISMAYQLPVKLRTHLYTLESTEQIFSIWDSLEDTGFRAPYLTIT